MSSRQSESDHNPADFRCLDRQAEIEKTQRHLPHWFQVGAAIFVTFRTADSMPKSAVIRLIAELEHWLKQNNLPLELANGPNEEEQQNAAAIVPNCDPKLLVEFKKLRDRAWHRSLDECHGACLLKQRAFAQIVAEALLHHEGKTYNLDRFIVMPNHVHAIVQFRPGSSMRAVGQSWMRYTARQINFETGNTGPFWQSEPFDHIIRSAEQFAYLQAYVADNPAKAKLRDGDFLYWQREQPN